jgi:hypothetical protein
MISFLCRHLLLKYITRTGWWTRLRVLGVFRFRWFFGCILNLSYIFIFHFMVHCFVLCRLRFPRINDVRFVLTPICFEGPGGSFSNISAISWRPALVVEEAGINGENHRLTRARTHVVLVIGLYELLGNQIIILMIQTHLTWFIKYVYVWNLLVLIIMKYIKPKTNIPEVYM